MESTISDVINNWANSNGLYSFEIRLPQLLNPSQIGNNDPFLEVVLIIDVSGFFLDKEHTMPVKLHRERVISIDRYNSTPEYINDLKRDIDLFTITSYAEFETILKSFESTTYTSDPQFMK